MGIQGVLRGYWGLQGVTGGYKGLRGVTRGYNKLEGVTWGYKGLQNVNKLSNFSPKPWTNPFGKMPILWLFKTDVLDVQNGVIPI